MTRLVGINHIALEVDDVGQALEWYGQFFELEVDGRHGSQMVFVDMGGRSQPPDTRRHFGLVVDDKEAVRAELRQAGLNVRDSGSLDFNDPWGNHLQVVDYRDIQFSKTPGVLQGMCLDGHDTRDSAVEELRQKGLVGKPR